MRRRPANHRYMHALRAAHAFDGTRFVPDGATVVWDEDRIVAVLLGVPAAYVLHRLSFRGRALVRGGWWSGSWVSSCPRGARA